LEQLAEAMGEKITVNDLKEELDRYESYGNSKSDPFGKKQFTNFRGFSKSSAFYLGRVQPARHYCMGGLAVNVDGQVLRRRSNGGGGSVGEPIPYLYAVGEVTGGIHGWNRLGGNGMTEGVVFGRRVGLNLPLLGTTGKEKN